MNGDGKSGGLWERQWLCYGRERSQGRTPGAGNNRTERILLSDTVTAALPGAATAPRACADPGRW